MTEQEFWTVIDTCSQRLDLDARAQCFFSQLMRRDAATVKVFGDLFEEMLRRANHWDLWGAATLLADGCSDDGFVDFRSWLVSLGGKRFRAALNDPDSLASIRFGRGGEQDLFFEEFRYVPLEAYLEKTGQHLELQDVAVGSEPAGAKWTSFDELADRLPQLWAIRGAKS